MFVGVEFLDDPEVLAHGEGDVLIFEAEGVDVAVVIDLLLANNHRLNSLRHHY